MSNGSHRRERLHRLIDLALAYRGTTKSELAGQLERDRSRLYPDTDNPKLDLVVGLAEALEWSIDAVVEYIQTGVVRPGAASQAADFETLDRQAVEAYHQGRRERMVELSQAMFAVAGTPDQRARACRLEGAAWGEQMGLPKALAAFQRGLEIAGISPTQRLALQSSLANTYYTLWQLTEAVAVAQLVLAELAECPIESTTDRLTQAFALYVRGNALRRMLAAQPADAPRLAARARADLTEAEELYRQIAKSPGCEYVSGIAHTCRGALLEVDVALGRRAPRAALDEILVELEDLNGDQPWPEGDWLESYGWWCDCGANIALRHCQGRDLQRLVAVFSNKLLEITRRFHSWPLLQRAVYIQYTLHEHVAQATGLEVPITLDTEDLRLITGAIGRFPHFRQMGWNLLENAAIVQTSRKA